MAVQLNDDIGAVFMKSVITHVKSALTESLSKPTSRPPLGVVVVTAASGLVAVETF